MRQASLFPRGLLAPTATEHGGSVRPGRRKIARPFSARRPMHVVLRSTLARGRWSLRRPETEELLRKVMRTLAHRNDVRVYEFANAGNHVHMVVRAKQRPHFQAFLRAFAGIAARLVTGARRGRPVGKFWDDLAYSRLLRWGREFDRARAYVIRNEFEARGLLPYEPRRKGSPTRHERLRE
jgi:REP element-mobilizing transposase RayT